MKWTFKPLSDRGADLGESPVWSPQENCVWWVDIDGCRLLRTDVTDGKTQEWAAPEPVGCIVLKPDGTLVAGLATGLFVFDRATGNFHKACAPETREDVRFNDSAIDPAGRIWAGTMHRENAHAAGAIFCIEPDFSHRRVFDGLWTSNGLAFDVRLDRMYFSDSHPSVQTIWVCDYDIATGVPTNRRVFATTHHLAGRPDGAFVDADSSYWIAGIGGAQLLQFSPDGTLMEIIAVPVQHPTKLSMDAHNPRSIFLTSRRLPGSDPSGFLMLGVLR
jgi:sugar lactone lactonase YvrE